MTSYPKFRLAIIAALTEKLSGRIGRTGIMKLTFFLQEMKGVPLGYSYRIYTYGPYDGQVLADLKMAESLGAVRSEPFDWEGGSGYAIHSGKKLAMSPTDEELFLKYKDAVDWVAREFGDLSATDLELESTVFYV